MGQGQNQPSSGGHPIDKDAITNYADQHAEPHSLGKCAVYCRKAFEAGGVDTNGHPVDAKDWGPTLLKNGASVVSPDGYTPQKADVAVFAGSDAHPYGHITIYDGKQWVSDIAVVRAISKAAEPEDRVFTNITGKPAKSLYTSLIADLLKEANLREGTQGVPRSTYCFRHTYATLRLQEGVDVYFLAEQMGTSVHMIEEHYGHVNTIKHADRVLQGMAGWELPHAEVDVTRAKASKAAETHDKSKRGQHRRAG